MTWQPSKKDVSPKKEIIPTIEEWDDDDENAD